MEANAEAIVEQEVIEVPQPVIEIVDVENPSWVSMYQPFLDMVKRFVEHDLKDIPSIKYETLLNYMAATVDGICKQKLMGIHDSMIQSKIQAGIVDGELMGFHMFHMLANRLPHVQTLNWAYIYSEDPRVTYRFALEVEKFRKIWKAQFLTTTVTNPRLNKIMKRLFKKCTVGGTYYIARGVRHALIKC